ncbi:MAG: sigma-70 family RNA polymerase sigma factor [Bacteroidota bacterium]
MANNTDEQILQLLAQKGSYERGFRLLISTYQERLYWQIRRLVIEHEDANDVLQNCFIKIYKNIDRFKGNSKLYTWLYRIATNEAITFLNKKQRKATIAIDDEGLHLSNKLEADTYFDGSRAQLQLQKALCTLPEKQRAVFNLRYFEEMSYKDMSAVMGTSVGALKASYHHAVKKIEHYLKSVEI